MNGAARRDPIDLVAPTWNTVLVRRHPERRNRCMLVNAVLLLPRLRALTLELDLILVGVMR